MKNNFGRLKFLSHLIASICFYYAAILLFNFNLDEIESEHMLLLFIINIWQIIILLLRICDYGGNSYTAFLILMILNIINALILIFCEDFYEKEKINIILFLINFPYFLYYYSLALFKPSKNNLL